MILTLALVASSTVGTSSVALTPREQVIAQALTDAWRAEDQVLAELDRCERKLDVAVAAASTPQVRTEREAWARPVVGCLAGLVIGALADREGAAGALVGTGAGCDLGLLWGVLP